MCQMCKVIILFFSYFFFKINIGFIIIWNYSNDLLRVGRAEDIIFRFD